MIKQLCLQAVKARIATVITQEAKASGITLDNVFVDGCAGELSNCLEHLTGGR